jgi:hypothetical protein
MVLHNLKITDLLPPNIYAKMIARLGEKKNRLLPLRAEPSAIFQRVDEIRGEDNGH